MPIITTDILLLFIVIFINIVLGLAVLLDRTSGKKAINITFFLIVLFIIIWTVSNYIADKTLDDFWVLFCAKSAYAATSIIGGLFFYFSLIFPEGKKNNFGKNVIIFSLPVVFFVLSCTFFVIKNVQFNLGKTDLIPGPAYIPFTIYFAIYLGLAFYMLIKKYFSSGGAEKQQIKYFFIGAFLTSVSSFFSNLIIPVVTNNWTVSHYGPYFTIFLVGFTTYAILKHHLFNLKVIATELFTLAISFILFIKIFSSNGNQDLLFNIGIFASMMLFGMLLVRGVIREVRHREEMEKMAEEIKKAYEVEKRAKEQTEKAYTLEKKANAELEALGNVKNQFLMTIQHHLRTPLTSMRGYADLLLGGSYGKMPKKIEEVVKKFEASTSSLIKMVNDFLDVTQFQLGKKTIVLKDGVGLCPILEEIAHDSEIQAKNKGISLKFDAPADNHCIIKADESKLKAALVNILDNSVKYTKEGSVVMSARKENNKVIVTIKDTGMGIAKDRLPKLFNSTFQRTEESKKTFSEGRGIGLYLSREIIEAHNGKIWAESEGEGKGSTFFIELPIE